MRLTGWLYLVTASHGRYQARRVNGDASRLAADLRGGECIVSAKDEETAIRIAKVLATAREARDLVSERNAAYREGYAHALGELRIELARLRNEQPGRPTGQYAGVTDGRVDMLDTLERWALSVAATAPPEEKA